MTKARTRYRHRQVGWVILGSLTAVALFLVSGLFAAGLSTSAVAGAAIVICVALLFGTLDVRIDERVVSLRFGVGIIRRTIALADVRTFSEVKNPWYYGWGIRLVPGGLLYNVSGLSAVELWLKNGRRVRVGTDEPEALHRALVDVLGPQ